MPGVFLSVVQRLPVILRRQLVHRVDERAGVGRVDFDLRDGLDGGRGGGLGRLCLGSRVAGQERDEGEGDDASAHRDSLHREAS